MQNAIIPDDVILEEVFIGKLKTYLIKSKHTFKNPPAVLWIHGGGYLTGHPFMIFESQGINLVRKYGAVVLTPKYSLSFHNPYPAAINECYAALKYLKDNAEGLGANPNQIMVGGESAGGGLCAALCMMARDKGEVNIAYQMPLYPMLDNFDTDSSKDNHGKIWDTRKNHIAWKIYLRHDYHKNVSPYAAPARQTNYCDLPPAYTFVGTGEPFYCETVKFIENLKLAGVKADIDIFETDIHAFDMLEKKLEISKQATLKFCQHFEYALNNYFSKN